MRILMLHEQLSAAVYRQRELLRLNLGIGDTIRGGMVRILPVSLEQCGMRMCYHIGGELLAQETQHILIH